MISKRFRLSVVIGAALLGGTGASFADDCDAVLNADLMNKSVLRDQTLATSAVRQKFCAMSAEEATTSENISLGGSYGLYSGNGAAGRSNFNSWKKSNCDATSSDDLNQGYHFAAQNAVSEKALSAWEACKRRDVNLACFIRPTDDPNLVTIITNWTPPGAQPTIIESATIINGTNADSNRGSELYPKDSSMYPGRDVLYVKRSPGKPVSAKLSVIYGKDFRRSCEVFAPVLPKIPKSEPNSTFSIKGKWCVPNSFPQADYSRVRISEASNEYKLELLMPAHVSSNPGWSHRAFWGVKYRKMRLEQQNANEVRIGFSTAYFEDNAGPWRTMIFRIVNDHSVELVTDLANDVDHLRKEAWGAGVGWYRCD